MNTIHKESKGDIITYTLRGPLNMTLKSKLKNRASTILNHANNPRNLSSLEMSKETSAETKEMLSHARVVKPDLQEPAVQIAVLHNKFEYNIISNLKHGTYIKATNKNKHFKNIGPLIQYANRNMYFLRRGSGAKLLQYVIDEQKERGIKTILVYPTNKQLEIYYSKFGFKPLTKVPRNLNNRRITYDSGGSRLMVLEL